MSEKTMFESAKFTPKPRFPWDLKQTSHLVPNDYGYYPVSGVNANREISRRNSLVWITEASATYKLDPPKWLKGKRLDQLRSLELLSKQALVLIPRKERHLRAWFAKRNHASSSPGNMGITIQFIRASRLLEMYRNLYFGIRDLLSEENYSPYLANCLIEVASYAEKLESEFDFPDSIYQ